MMTIEAERDLLSITRLCELCQCTPRAIELAAAKADTPPTLRLNGTPYWDSSQAQKIREHLDTTKGSK
jgi:hypothetical protein